jgi:hypothetical protein
MHQRRIAVTTVNSTDRISTMTDTSAETPATGNELGFPVFTPEIRAALMRYTEAEFMLRVDAWLAAELDDAIAPETAADDAWNAARERAPRIDALTSAELAAARADPATGTQQKGPNQ